MVKPEGFDMTEPKGRELHKQREGTPFLSSPSPAPALCYRSFTVLQGHLRETLQAQSGSAAAPRSTGTGNDFKQKEEEEEKLKGVRVDQWFSKLPITFSVGCDASSGSFKRTSCKLQGKLFESCLAAGPWFRSFEGWNLEIKP